MNVLEGMQKSQMEQIYMILQFKGTMVEVMKNTKN